MGSTLHYLGYNTTLLREQHYKTKGSTLTMEGTTVPSTPGTTVPSTQGTTLNRTQQYAGQNTSHCTTLLKAQSYTAVLLDMLGDFFVTAS